MIYETLVTTLNERDEVHIAPMGITRLDGRVLIAPFKPSTTLDNLSRSRAAVINMTDDVSIFAGCVTGRRNWAVKTSGKVNGRVLEAALAHIEVEVESIEENRLRPRFLCREVYASTHAPFRGFNRAQAAVVEAAILVSRLHMLSLEKIDAEIDYLRIAIEKTAGAKERLAWSWLLERIDQQRCETQGEARST